MQIGASKLSSGLHTETVANYLETIWKISGQ